MSNIFSFIQEHSVLFVIILSFILCFIYYFIQRKKLDLKIYEIIILDLLHTIVFLFSCKFLAYVEYGISNRTFDFSNKYIGYSFFGNIYIMPILYLVYALITKRKISKMFDVATPAILISAFCARLNCVINGCCEGAKILGTNFLFPTRELEIICYITIFLIVVLKLNKGTLKPGTAYPIYMMIYGFTRMFEVPFRHNFATDKIHFAFIHCPVVIIIGFMLYREAIKAKDKNKNEI